MGPQNRRRQLSCISTSWSMVYQAHQGAGDEVVSAQRLVLLRYYHPIYRYLLAMVRDVDSAEELTQEFVVRFLRGDFKRADPSLGRFRDLLKRALRHLAIDHWRRKRVEKDRTPIPLVDDWQVTPADADWRRSPPPRRRRGSKASAEGDWRRCPPPRRGPATPDLDNAEAELNFLEGWRGEMLAQAWEALAGFQEESGCCYHTVLSTRAEHPEAHSAELAGRASTRLGKPLSEGSFRQLLCRAREKFADLLVAAVAQTLAVPDADAVEEELIELDLLSYCRRSIARMRKSSCLEHTEG